MAECQHSLGAIMTPEADAMIDVEPERVVEVSVDAFLGEPVAGSASVCTNQHSMRTQYGGMKANNAVTGAPFASELVECVSLNGEMIGRGIRLGVARAQMRAQDSVSPRNDRQQPVVTVASFVVRAGVLPVGFGDQSRSDGRNTGGVGRSRPSA